MAWVRLDSAFMGHPKVVAAGGDAALLFVSGLCYCNTHLTDGRIPAAMVARLTDRRGPDKLAARLVSVGLWERDGDSFIVHDFAEYQPTAAAVRAERVDLSEKRRLAGRMGGIASGVARASAVKLLAANGEANEASAKQDASKDEARTGPCRTVLQDTRTPRAGARSPVDVAWSTAAGTLSADLSDLIRLREHVDACAESAQRDPDELFSVAVVEFKALRETFTNGKIPTLSPRKLLEHWPSVWERITGTAPAGQAPASTPKHDPKRGRAPVGDFTGERSREVKW